jgi:hypothetical protein
MEEVNLLSKGLRDTLQVRLGHLECGLNIQVKMMSKLLDE